MEGVTTMVYKETYDTPIPDELRPAYDAWYNQLPRNLQYTGDYDLQGAWLERLGRPTKYESTQNGHLDDYGKKPNHPTFSSGSKWHDPKIPERTGGEWKKADDGSWDFYPGTGNVLTDDQLEKFFEKYEKGNRVHRRTEQTSKGGKASRAALGGGISMYGGAMGVSFEDLKKGTNLIIGTVGKVIDRAVEPVERGVAYAADYWSDKGYEPVAAAFRGVAPAVLGLRAANAHLTSGGGANFTPVPRDERHFSTKALENISDNLALHGGTRTERFAPIRGAMSDMSWWESSQGLGGSRVVDGKVTDVFDINKGEPGETLLSALFGSSSDPDEGKITTKIPVDLLPDPKRTRQDSKGGNVSRAALNGGETGEESVNSVNEVPEGTEQTVQNNGGPRIIVNPSTFRNEKDALCVAMNEAFRIIMEVNGFDPVSEPTERQRKFFSDTAYNDDELMLRRTILARICTFDTSVKDPTDEQLQEAMEFLDTVMEIGAPQNEWEQRAVKRIRDTIAQSVGQPRAEEPSDEEPPEDTGTITGAVGGGESEDDLEDLFDEPPNLDNGSLDSLFDTQSNTEKETERRPNRNGRDLTVFI